MYFSVLEYFVGLLGAGLVLEEMKCEVTKLSSDYMLNPGWADWLNKDFANAISLLTIL